MCIIAGRLTHWPTRTASPIFSDVSCEWAVAKKIEDVGTNSSQDLAQKELLLD